MKSEILSFVLCLFAIHNLFILSTFSEEEKKNYKGTAYIIFITALLFSEAIYIQIHGF
jgi:hypothetical protein